MPATEQTWRNQRLMHIVFGVTGLVLLLSTVWMLYADYNRGWKPIQRQAQQIDNWFTNARITEGRTGQYVAERAELQSKLQQVQSEAPPADLVDRLVADLEGTAAAEHAANIQELDADLRQDATRANRQDLLDGMQAAIKKLRFREDDLARQRKFERANLDVAKSEFDLAVGGGLSTAELDVRETAVRDVEQRVDVLTADYEQAKTHRMQVEADYAAIVAPETAAQKKLDQHISDLAQLEKTYETQSDPLRNILTLPILDAFGSPLKPKQIWLPSLPQYNNFKDVARFDRCTTCHLGIEKTATGSAVLPGYEQEHRLTTDLDTPAEPPKDEPEPEVENDKRDAKQVAYDRQQRQLADMYGLVFADRGLLGEEDVTVEAVWPYKAGAQAGLKAGDVIEFIGDTKVTSEAIAVRALLETADWGQPLKLKIRRGLPQPFSSHPRLDLFLGSLSPHTTEKFGCTICHQGQGSATEFKWASHTPNDLTERGKWKSDHNWFDNHHWIFPMYPERFLESSCLKCHHEVVDLEPSERFPEPPAPKVVAGYNVIRQYGCFGCHEINGYNGTKRIGPDLRTEPNYAAAAQQLLADPALPDQARDWANSLLEDIDRVEPRHLLSQFVEADASRAAASNPDDPAVLSVASHAMVSPLGDVESPGQLRKSGPSLRFVGSKTDASFLLDWISNPTNFRPSTKMPRFFGQVAHLDVPESQDVAESADGPSGLEEANKFEPVEIQATVSYLLGMSQPFEYLSAPEGVNQPPSVERGKYLFETRGCLACHQHKDFPKATGVQGPELSRIGAKLSSASAADKLYDWSTNGPRWLYSWVRKPNRYHARTVMPDVQLEKITKGEDISDPAADITAYLLESQEGWKPAAAPAFNEATLRELAVKHLRDKVTERQANAYADHGIPADQAGGFKGDEALLVGEFNDDNREARLLQYVGKRTISKYGCAGCHDIPGFEDAKPIGTGLNNWARKDLSQLAFEQIGTYVSLHGPGSQSTHHGEDEGHADHGTHGLGHGPDLDKLDDDTGYFMHSLLNHQRDGFLWQKLREPRSYDYMKTENKGYNERLRMPKFNFTKEQSEQVMTFVLGLVAEPPPPQYIYSPDPRQKAIVEGRKVLEKFNCAGCHELQTKQWEFKYDPTNDYFAEERTFPENEFEFFRPHFSPKEVADSKKIDRRGFGHAKISARVFMTEDGQPVEDVDEDDNPIKFYALWKPTLVNGQPWLSADQLVIRDDWITGEHDPVGGEFARLLHPVALAHERETVPATKYENAWGFVPPPLEGEGRKVQPDWLYNFLLDPHPIRPAVVLRMPHFPMSADDASKLVDYFAASDDANFPYEFDRRSRESYLQSNELEQPGRLNDGAVIATNVCVKCHLVGNYSPPGSDAAKAPDLAKVHQRLRPEFTLHWVGNPARLLPYTAMNKNIAPDKPLDKKATRGEGGELIEHGTGLQQLQAVVDFVQNYDYFMKQRNQLEITAPPPEPAPGEEPSADDAQPADDAEGDAADDSAPPSEEEAESNDESSRPDE
ncbi:MAG: hypothetical protein AB7O62_12005 [Pirellulales bacterium]